MNFNYKIIRCFLIFHKNDFLNASATSNLLPETTYDVKDTIKPFIRNRVYIGI